MFGKVKPFGLSFEVFYRMTQRRRELSQIGDDEKMEK